MEDRRPVLLGDNAVSAIRRLIGIDRDGAIIDLAAMERLDDFWDMLAGPHGLTVAERDAIRACRERFGHYDPTNIYQICFLAERDKTPVVAEPEPAVWDRYLRKWKAA